MTIDQEYLAESFIMALFGLNPSRKTDIAHLQQLRRQGLPFVRLSRKVRLYPRAELVEFFAKSKMQGVDE